MQTRVDNFRIAHRGVGRVARLALFAALALAGSCASTANLDAGAEQRKDGDPLIRATAWCWI